MDQNQLQSFVKNAVGYMELSGRSPYAPRFAGGNSGLSFGNMQNDVANNPAAKTAFTQIIDTQISTNGFTQAQADQIIQLAATKGVTQANFSPSQLNVINQALAANTTAVDQADASRLSVVMGYVDGALQAAASNPNGPGELNVIAPDPQFLTELAEWGNRSSPPGLTATDTYLSTASSISQSSYEQNYLFNQKQFTTNGESTSNWQARVSTASNYGLQQTGSSIAYYYPDSSESIDITPSDLSSTGSNYFSLSTNSSGNPVGTLWSFAAPGTSIGPGSLQINLGSGKGLGTFGKGTVSDINFDGANVTADLTVQSNQLLGTLNYNSTTGIGQINTNTGTQINFNNAEPISISSTPQGTTAIDLGAGISGLQRQAVISNDGSTTFSVGGSTAFTAPAGSLVSDTNGSLTVTTQTGAGYTDVQSINASDQVTGVCTASTPFGVVSITDTINAAIDSATPNVVSLNGTVWTPTSSNLSVGGFLTTDANTIGGTSFTTQQTQTQSLLNSYGSDIATGNITGLPTIPDASSFFPTLSFASTDTADIGTVDQSAGVGNYDFTYSDPLDTSGGSSTYTNTLVPTGGGDNGGDTDPGNPDGDPLVLSLDGNGINLVSAAQSGVSFDFTGSGAAQQTGWIGADTGFLVYDPSGGPITNGTQLLGNSFAPGATNGFAALATLDSNGDGVINASDPAYNQLQVWVDSNGDGVTEPGELYSLADLGIASISIASTSMVENVGGNLITSVGTITFTDGSTEAIDDVTFGGVGSAGAPQLQGQSAAGLAYLSQVLRALPAGAEGSAAAVATQIGVAIQSLVAPETKVGDDETTGQKINPNGGTLNLWEINYYYYNPQEASPILSFASPSEVYSASTAVTQSMVAEKNAAQSVQTAAADQAQSETDAATADVEDAQLGSPDDVAARAAASTTEAAWQQAFSGLVNASTQLQVPLSQLATAQSALTQSLLPNKQYVYATTLDATDLDDAFVDQRASVQALTFGAAALQTLLAAAATAWNVSTVTLAQAGQTVRAAGGDLIVAASGTESLSDGATPSTYVILPGSNATVSGFHAGAGGSRIDFLDGSSGAATITQGANGAVITAGTSTVTLAGLSVAALSLQNNLAGIGSVTIDASGISFGASALSVGSIDDGTSHVTSFNLVGSNDSAPLSGIGATVSVTGGGNTITSGADDLLLINGTGGSADTINATGDAFGGKTRAGQATGILLGVNIQVNVDGSNNGIWAAAAGISLATYGGGNTITGSAGDAITIGGTDGVFDIINANGIQNGGTTANGQATGILFSGLAQASVNGSNNGITLNGGGTVNLSGTGNMVSTGLSGGTINLANNATATVNGPFDTIAVGTGATATVTNGAYDDVTGSNASIVVSGAGTTGLTISGNNNQVTITGNSSTVNVDGNGDAITLVGTGNTVTIAGNNEAVNGNVVGNTILIASGTGNTIQSANLGTATDFLGLGGSDDFLLNADGSISVDEFGPGNTYVSRLNLKQWNGLAFDLGTTTLAGSGADFLGDGGRDVFFAISGGGLVVDEFDPTGTYQGNLPLTQWNGAAWAMGTSTIAGTGADFLGVGGRDVFFASTTGALTVDEFAGNGVYQGAVALEQWNGAAWTLGGATIAGTGADFLGDGGRDVFFASAAGALSVDEFNAAGVYQGVLSLEQWNGTPLTLVSATIAGTGSDFLGDGGQDVFFINQGGALSVEEFNSSSNGGALFDPTNPANATITNATVLAAVNQAWHH